MFFVMLLRPRAPRPDAAPQDPELSETEQDTEGYQDNGETRLEPETTIGKLLDTSSLNSRLRPRRIIIVA